MTVNRIILNNPGNKTLDLTTATGIHYTYTPDCAGDLQIALTEAVVTTPVVNPTTPAVASLQLVRNAVTYTLGTATFPDGTGAGRAISFVGNSNLVLPGETAPTDLRKNPFFRYQAGDVIQVNVTTAGLGGTPAGAYEVNLVLDKASSVI